MHRLLVIREEAAVRGSLLTAHPGIAAAMGARRISQSCALQITALTGKLPKELRKGTGKILLEAASGRLH